MEPTKAPWIAHDTGEGYSITDQGGIELARLFNKDGRYTLSDHSNARLMALAPELLSTLKRAREWIWHNAQDEFGNIHASMRPVLASYDAVIARAEGR